MLNTQPARATKLFHAVVTHKTIAFHAMMKMFLIASHAKAKRALTRSQFPITVATYDSQAPTNHSTMRFQASEIAVLMLSHFSDVVVFTDSHFSENHSPTPFHTPTRNSQPPVNQPLSCSHAADVLSTMDCHRPENHSTRPSHTSTILSQASEAQDLIFSHDSPRNAVNLAQIFRPVSVLVKNQTRPATTATIAATIAPIGFAIIALPKSLKPVAASCRPLTRPLFSTPAILLTAGPSFLKRPPALASPGNIFVKPVPISVLATPKSLKCFVVSDTALPRVPRVPATLPIGPTTAFAVFMPTKASTRALTTS